MLNTFEFEIDGVKRRFWMGNYALVEMLSEQGINPSEILDAFNAANEVKSVCSFMYHAAFFQAKMDKKEIDFDRLDVWKWVDITGGFGGEFYKEFYAAMLKAMGVKMTDEPVSEEKKSETSSQ